MAMYEIIRKGKKVRLKDESVSPWASVSGQFTELLPPPDMVANSEARKMAYEFCKSIGMEIGFLNNGKVEFTNTRKM